MIFFYCIYIYIYIFFSELYLNFNNYFILKIFVASVSSSRMQSICMCVHSVCMNTPCYGASCGLLEIGTSFLWGMRQEISVALPNYSGLLVARADLLQNITVILLCLVGFPFIEREHSLLCIHIYCIYSSCICINFIYFIYLTEKKEDHYSPRKIRLSLRT